MSFRQDFIRCPECGTSLCRVFSYSGTNTTPKTIDNMGICKKCNIIYKLEIKVTRI